jgi:crotonobetainyl-CoA:carnitine CoA-transferase CaiB-like acyl-CoA transferase
VLNVGNDSQWRSFCDAAGAKELGNDPRFRTNRQRVERRAEVIPKIEMVMKSLPTAEWEKRLTEANVPHAVVLNHAQIFAHPQMAARGMKVTVRDPSGNPVDLVGNPIHLFGAGTATPRMPPTLGAQTDEVLRELGLRDADVAALRAKGVV